MNKKAQFKVALRRYLNTHSFYSVEEFLMFKNDLQYVQKFFSYCLLYVPCEICVHLMSIFFVFFFTLF
jgi:hypothetical protein